MWSAEVDDWCVEWQDHIRLNEEDVPQFTTNTVEYLGEMTNVVGQIIFEDEKFHWGLPYVGFREDFRSQSDLIQKQKNKEYLAKVYGSVKTVADYDAVLNHGYVLQIGQKFKSHVLACCDLSGISRYELKGFFLSLGQKKLVEKEEFVKETLYQSLPVLTPMGKYRQQCVEMVDGIRQKGVVPKVEKGIIDTYTDSEKAQSYLSETLIGHLDDAVAILSNIDEPTIVIPGDGYGVFTQVARLLGKEVVSGDSSREMVKLALKLGTVIQCEDALKTVERGFRKFGKTCLVLISFLWTVVPAFISHCMEQGYRVLVYDKYLYYKGSSKLKSYGNELLRGVNGIGWLGLPFKLSEDHPLIGHKPMLTELMKGPLFFDSIKGLRQISMYAEMYPDQIQVSDQSKVDPGELYEMSQIHKFRVVKSKPVVWFVRVPHNGGNGLVYDVDKWEVVPQTLDINAHLLGSVRADHMESLFGKHTLVARGRGMGRGRGGARKVTTTPRMAGNAMVSKQNRKFKLGRKYYMKASAKLTPYVKPLYKDDKVQVVWLRQGNYVYEEDIQKKTYVRCELSA